MVKWGIRAKRRARASLPMTKPDDRAGSYRSAPHFGRTLGRFDEITEKRIFEHRPILVDLPLEEPQLEDRKKPRGNQKGAADEAAKR